MLRRSGRCPKCDKQISTLTASTVAINAGVGSGRSHGVIYTCPLCGVILGAGMDPLVLLHDTADEIVNRLRRAGQEARKRARTLGQRAGLPATPEAGS